MKNIKAVDITKSVLGFIRGERTKNTAAFDWDIPLHWGGVSDPFQPLEREARSSMAVLKLLAEYGYPVIISTKGVLIAHQEYLNILKQCNAVVQVSLVAPLFDKYERVKFTGRLRVLDSLSRAVKRLIVRVQPYIPEILEDLLKLAPKYRELGVYGVSIEGLKLKKNVTGQLEKHYGDFVIPYHRVRSDFLRIKEEFNSYGIKVFGAENRVRSLGDSLTCCGVDGVPGFKVNKFNLNHLLFDKTTPLPSAAMKETGVGVEAFRPLLQDTLHSNELKKYSFEDLIGIYRRYHSDVIG